MNKFDQNLQVLETKGTHFLSLNEQIGETALSYEGTDEEGTKWFWDERGTPVAITSEFDSANLPDKELKQIIFFFGLTSIEEIVEVSRYANPSSLFVIIEPNLSVLRYALNIEDFSKLASINYMIAAVEANQMDEVLKSLVATKAFLLLKKPVFYLNSYYRRRDITLVKEYIIQIRDSIKHKFFRIGNSILDSLLGLIHNMQNLKAISVAPDTAAMKDCFKGYPAFVVAAGPSLDKNIEYLKKVGTRGIIIAVDTIAEKLVKNGIIPHVISSVERLNVWEYFFENKPPYYEHSYFVAPPVVQPAIIKAFNGRSILPMRQSVREYRWLSDILGLSEDYKVWMGASCVHTGIGLALHIGASPIVLVGQDLAYGEDITKTHASGTEYDKLPMEAEIADDILTVEGYYGQDVKTRLIWNDFRVILENLVGDLSIRVINATEGGARIKGTEQKSLSEVIAEFCTREIDGFSVFRNIPQTSIDWSGVSEKMRKYVNQLELLSSESLEHLKQLQDVRDKWEYYIDQLGTDGIFKILSKTDEFFQLIPRDELLYHNLQGPMVILLQKFHLIPENGSLESIRDNLLVQIEFCTMFTDTVWLVAQVIQENFPWDVGTDGVES